RIFSYFSSNVDLVACVRRLEAPGISGCLADRFPLGTTSADKAYDPGARLMVKAIEIAITALSLLLDTIISFSETSTDRRYNPGPGRSCLLRAQGDHGLKNET